MLEVKRPDCGGGMAGLFCFMGTCCLSPACICDLRYCLSAARLSARVKPSWGVWIVAARAAQVYKLSKQRLQIKGKKGFDRKCWTLRPFSSSLPPLRSTFHPSRSYLYWLRTGRITAVRGPFLGASTHKWPDAHRDDSRLSTDSWQKDIKYRRSEGAAWNMWRMLLPDSRAGWGEAAVEVCSKTKWSG